MSEDHTAREIQIFSLPRLPFAPEEDDDMMGNPLDEDGRTRRITVSTTSMSSSSSQSRNRFCKDDGDNTDHHEDDDDTFADSLYADPSVNSGRDLRRSQNSPSSPVKSISTRDDSITESCSFASSSGGSYPEEVTEQEDYPEVQAGEDSATRVKHKRRLDGVVGKLHTLLEVAQWQSVRQLLQQLQDNHPEQPDDLPYILRTKGRTLRSGKARRNILHLATQTAPPQLILYLLQLVVLIEQQPPPFFLLLKDEKGNTPLHIACANLNGANRLEWFVLKNLAMLAPEALTVPNQHGDTPFHLLAASTAFSRTGKDITAEIAAEDALETLFSALEDKLDGDEDHAKTAILRQNERGLTTLHAAIANHAHERVLISLLEICPEMARVPDEDGNLPLHYVAKYGIGPWTWVQTLIDAAPESVWAQSQNHETPLHVLVAHASEFLQSPDCLDRNTTKLVEMLIGDVALPETSQDNETVTIDLDCCPLLMTNKSHGYTPLHSAVVCQTPLPVIRHILQESPLAPVALATTTTTERWTPLHLVLRSSNTGILNDLDWLEVFCQNAEACMMQDHKGRTPLHLAFQNKKLKSSSVIKLLMEASAETTAVEDHSGNVPLHYAVVNKRVKSSMIKSLIKLDTESPAYTNKLGNTPLHLACKAGVDVAIVQQMVKVCPDAARIENAAGETPGDLSDSRTIQKILLPPSRMAEV